MICAQNITYLIEANFYSGGGSKLNEVARAYIEIAKKISCLPKYKFIWTLMAGVGTMLEISYKKPIRV